MRRTSGWAIGDTQDRGADAAWDADEADSLYSLLENEVIRLYYERDERGIPRGWVDGPRKHGAPDAGILGESRLAAVRRGAYLPLARAYCDRAASGGAGGSALADWKRRMAARWQEARFEAVGGARIGAVYAFSVQIHLGTIDPGDVQVEIYADNPAPAAPFRAGMTLDETSTVSPGAYVFRGTAAADRPLEEYTPRMIPRHAKALIPLELPLITWSK